jgi:predicted DsbA family dithiol-disulfide isomerase
VKYAQQLGLDVGRFQSDMTSQMVNSRVALDVRRGESMGVTGTPTIFVNGKMVGANEMEAAGLRKYITEALAQVNKPQ